MSPMAGCKKQVTKDLLKAAIAQFNLSGRGYDRILKVSRTIVDMEDAERIEMHHVAGALTIAPSTENRLDEDRRNKPQKEG